MTEKMFRTEDGVAVELTQEEIEEVLQMRQEAAQLQTQRKAEAETKAAEKQAILDRIGLTADELKTILG